MILQHAEFTQHPAPAYATPRDPAYMSEVDEIERCAQLLGFRFQPWQRQVVEVATEYQPDAMGRRIYHYEKVLISVPRQSGKTTLMGPVQLHRMLTRPGVSGFSTAQTGKDAGKRMRDLLDLIERSPVAPLFKLRRSNGSEGFEVRGSKSQMTRFSPTTGALHGETPFFVAMDEIWKYSEELGDSMLGGADPAMITLDGQGQIWMISTMGTQASGFMNKWIAKGRAQSDEDLAYFEWSMPDGSDLEDPATLWAYHPALGNTITERALVKRMHADGLSKAERLRAYGNRLTDAENPLIDADVWEDLAADPLEVPALSDVAIGYEVAPGNSCAAVVAAWLDTDGVPVVRVLHQAPGTAWLEGYIRWLHNEFEPKIIAADGAGPATRITDRLRPEDENDTEGIEVRPLPFAEFQAACHDLISSARDDRQLRHDGSRVLAAAVANAAGRIHNGRERIDRDRSAQPVPSLIAAAVALWAYRHAEAESGIQVF